MTTWRGWPMRIAPPVALRGFQQMQTLQVFSKSLANERGSIQLLPLGRNVGPPRELCVENNLYDFHFRLHDRAVFAQSQVKILGVHSGPRAVLPASGLAMMRPNESRNSSEPDFCMVCLKALEKLPIGCLT